MYDDCGGVPRTNKSPESGKSLQPVAQLRFRLIGDQRKHLVAEFAANRRAPLRDILGYRSKPIQPRHQGGVQRRRHRQGRMRHGR